MWPLPLKLELLRCWRSIENMGCGFSQPTLSLGYGRSREGLRCPFGASESFRNQEGEVIQPSLVKLGVPFPQWWRLMFAVFESFPLKYGMTLVAKGKTEGLFRS